MDLKINKKGLGRGLSSLMGEVSDEQTESLSSTETKIPISKLRPSPIQQEEFLKRLVSLNSQTQLKSKGLVQPILVRPSKSNPGDYEIIAGERRWRAAQVAQLHEISAVSKKLR
jgi:ParB family chromosome partitioning protein